MKTLYRNIKKFHNFNWETIFVPRIPLISNNFPFKFKRLQSTHKVSFAETINIYQGQILKFAGIELKKNFFHKGNRAYVVCSRSLSIKKFCG